MTTTTVPRHLPHRIHYTQPATEPGRTEYGVELIIEKAYDTQDFELYALLPHFRPDLSPEQLAARIDELIDLSQAVADAITHVERECSRDEYETALRRFVGAM